MEFYFHHEEVQELQCCACTEDSAEPPSVRATVVSVLDSAVCGNMTISNTSQTKELQLPSLRCLQPGLQSSTTVSTHVLNTLQTRLACSCKLHILLVFQNSARGSPNAKGNCASEEEGNDRSKRKLIIDTVFLSSSSHCYLKSSLSLPGWSYLVLSCLPAFLYPMCLFFLLEHSKGTVSSCCCQWDRVNSSLVWIWILRFV